MDWLVEKLTELYRHWYNDGLPDDLAFGEVKGRGFVRGSMTRTAHMALALGFPLGIFQLLGIEYAQRAANAWRPRERLLMEDVSCAFEPLSARAARGKPVPEVEKDRLLYLLDRYLAYVKTPWTRERIRDAIERFIVDCPPLMDDASDSDDFPSDE